MNSSGIKRGLATTAITALAVTGLPFLATQASAEPFSTQVPDANSVELATPDWDISTKNDGQDTTFRLQALGGNNVASVRFEYSLNPGAGTPTWTTIATVASRNDDGSFAYDWSAAGLDGASLDVRVLGFNSAGTQLDSEASSTTVDNSLETVNLDNGSALGYFVQPYGGAQDNVTAGASGTASSAGQGISIWQWTGTDFGDEVGTATSATATGATVATWESTLDLTGYDFTGTPDQLLLNAYGDETADSEAFTLYSQTITTVTATAEDSQVQSNDSTTVTVTVKDQNGLPIAGAEVFSSNGDGPEYTNGNGEATFAQTAGTQYYYANATSSDPYEAELGDKRSESVTVTQYNPVETSISVTSRDGAAFDEDEFDYTPTDALGASNGANLSDIVGQVKDQNGNPIGEGGRTVTYRWVVTPFDAPPAGTPAADLQDTGTVLTDDEGKFSVPEPSTTYGDNDGTWELYVTLEEDLFGEGGIAETKALTVKNGDSTLAFDENSPEQATSGTSEEVTGSLTLADGTGLAGRSVLVDYNSAGDAYIVQTNPATTNDTDRVVTTDANGNFTVTVKDPTVTPNQPEENGTITASTEPQAEPDGNTNQDDPNEDTAGTQDVQFIESTTPGDLTIEHEDGDTDTIRPAELEEFTITVTDGATSPTELSNQEVTVTTDHGYFTDGTPAPAPVVGADAGTYKDLGQSTTVTTDENGEATIYLAMKRDEGFDDDGQVTSAITATAGSVSDTASQNWTSENPLNGGEVDIVFSPADEQESNNLPEAQVGQEVAFDVYTTDQFGNVAGGEEVTLSDNQSDAAIEGENDDVSNDPGYQVLSDYDDDGDFVATSEEEQDQTITGTWTTETYKYTNVNGATSQAGSETLTDSETVQWYDVNLAAAELTLTSNPEGPVTVGTAVTETLTAVDENGNPIENLEVQFIRSGPGSQPGETVTKYTNANGQAFYTFVGDQAGTATINVAVSDGNEVETLTDTVEFTAAGKINAGLTLRGGDNGAADDSLLANAINKTAGAEVNLFRRKADGSWKKIRTGVMNAKGNFRFEDVPDRNGNKITRYKAVVKATDETRKGVGKKKVR